MLRVLIFLVSLGARALRAICRCRADLVMENLALRSNWQGYAERESCHTSAILSDESRCNVESVIIVELYIIVALPRVGGLHHRHEWREAA